MLPPLSLGYEPSEIAVSPRRAEMNDRYISQGGQSWLHVQGGFTTTLFGAPALNPIGHRPDGEGFAAYFPGSVTERGGCGLFGGLGEGEMVTNTKLVPWVDVLAST